MQHQKQPVADAIVSEGLSGDVHDAADGHIVHAHFVGDEKEKHTLVVCISKSFCTFDLRSKVLPLESKNK